MHIKEVHLMDLDNLINPKFKKFKRELIVLSRDVCYITQNYQPLKQEALQAIYQDFINKQFPNLKDEDKSISVEIKEHSLFVCFTNELIKSCLKLLRWHAPSKPN